MLLIKVLDQLSIMFTEFVYMMACVIYKIYQYRWLMLTLLFLGGLFFYGLFEYGNMTN